MICLKLWLLGCKRANADKNTTSLVKVKKRRHQLFCQNKQKAYKVKNNLWTAVLEEIFRIMNNSLITVRFDQHGFLHARSDLLILDRSRSRSWFLEHSCHLNPTADQPSSPPLLVTYRSWTCCPPPCWPRPRSRPCPWSRPPPCRPLRLCGPVASSEAPDS